MYSNDSKGKITIKQRSPIIIELIIARAKAISQTCHFISSCPCHVYIFNYLEIIFIRQLTKLTINS